MADGTRILCPELRDRIMSAEEAAALIPSGVNVGMSGFTGAGYPKAVPQALARRIVEANQAGQKFKISVWTGASTAPELDGALATAEGIELRLPYQSDPTCRKRINAGEMEYLDIHLGHVAQFVRFGFLGKLDIALVEVIGVLEDGQLIPSTSVGNSATWLDQADRVILEVNAWQSPNLEGMHDVYYGTALPPHRKPIPILKPDDRSACPTCAAPARRCWRSWRPTPPIATPPSHRRTRSRGRSPPTSSTSWHSRLAKAGCQQTCSPSNPASATSPMPCWRASTKGRSTGSPPTRK
jgi:succinyl-CoA:acetate CoA-transferase